MTSGCSGTKFSAASDGGAGRDTGTTANIPSPCADGGAAAHQLCDDFDMSSSLAARWTTAPACQPAVVNSAESASPPNALLTPPQDGGAMCVIASTELSVALNTFVHCEFDVLEDGSPTADFLFFVLGTDASGYMLTLALTRGASPPFQVQESVVGPDGGTTSNPLMPLTNGPSSLMGWHHVAVLLLVGPPRTLTVTFDKFPASLVNLPLYAAGAMHEFISIGVIQYGGVNATLRHDNIFCDVK